MGRKIDLRSDWESVKISIMKNIVTLKFLQHPVLAKKLLNTGDQELIEGNNWNDTFRESVMVKDRIIWDKY